MNLLAASVAGCTVSIEMEARKNFSAAYPRVALFELGQGLV